MAISDIFATGQHKQEIGHFANVVKIARADSVITDEEKELLIRIAKNLHISLEEFTQIINNPEKFPINPPIDYEERIERLYRLTKMVLADGKAQPEEMNLLYKIVIGLNFSVNTAKKVCNTAIYLVADNTNINDFIKAIKKVNTL